jgi:hypothetical protein
MDELTKILETNRTLFFAGAFLWILLWILASIFYRKSRGKEILPSKPKNALFYEGWASGHSNRSNKDRVDTDKVDLYSRHRRDSRSPIVHMGNAWRLRRDGAACK